MYSSDQNDGTIAITKQVDRPLQGTFCGRADDGSYVVAKGIVRPPLITADGREEAEEAVGEAAFGRSISDAPVGKFYQLKEVGKERCNLSYQTLLFSVKDPVRYIDNDTAHLESMTALDLLPKESREKVKHGVPPNLLIEDMAPWDMMRKFRAEGVRATVFGSWLVGPGFDKVDSSITEAFKQAGYECNEDWEYTQFMLLPGSAYELSLQTGLKISEMYDCWFAIHRDPALPDSTSMSIARFAGIADWAVECNNKYGVVLHPKDPFWKAAGGDFDGDAASVYKLSSLLYPRQAVPRADYKINGRTYVSDDVGEQIIQSFADTTTGLLGPIILGAMRLAERNLDTPIVRSTAAAVAQASVQAKKHSVDTKAVNESAKYIFDEVRAGSEDGAKPYVSDYLNGLKNSLGVDGKLLAWGMLMRAIKDGTWEHGTAIEKSIVRRAKVINQLFEDVAYFKGSRQSRLPQPLIDAAIIRTPGNVADAVRDMSREYRSKAMLLADAESVEDQALREGLAAELRDELKIMREKFRLASITGEIEGIKADPKTVQVAMIAYGPAKIAARMVPSEVFAELGTNTRRVILNLVGHDWKNGEYMMSHINPIPGCLGAFQLFSANGGACQLEVISKAKNSTRVILTTS